jgi:hypothetical protein
MMACRRKNIIDGTTFEFPGFGFWVLHFFSIMFIFLWGMRYAMKRAAFPIIGYRFLKMLFKH